MSDLSFPAPPVPKKQKLGGYDFFRSIGSPKYVVAPMVDQSELAWRMLSRSPLPSDMAGPSTAPTSDIPYPVHPGGATLCYTPMIHAKVFSEAVQISKGGDGHFDLTHGEEGSRDTLAGIEGGDRPLFVQFCANDPDVLLSAAKKVEGRCDAVDINFGCPQGIAKRGRYGSFLQDDWETIKSLIGTLHENLAVPVTAKFRIFPDKERTIAYARMMEAAGAQILTCHGRTREMKGQLTGLADWEMIKAVKEAVKIPVFANGNILYREDVDRCLEVTGCDGVMSAEGNLSNPALFLPSDHPHAHPPLWVLANRYLDIVDGLKTTTAVSAIRAHLFRMLKPMLEKNEEFRNRISRASVGSTGNLGDFRAIIRDIEASVKDEIDVAGPSWRPPPIDSATGYRQLPPYVAQPYVRPAPPVIASAGAEVSTNGSDGAAPGSPSGTNVISHCSNGDPPCQSMGALRCPSRACLIHCREIGAIAKGMDPIEAAKEAQKGTLIGMGCEAHEAKFMAKREKSVEKRKAKQDGRLLKKARRKESKATKRAADKAESDRGEEEEEAFSKPIEA